MLRRELKGLTKRDRQIGPVNPSSPKGFPLMSKMSVVRHCTLTFRIMVYARLSISKKFSTLYDLIRNCAIINFKHFPLYSKLIQACTVIKFRHFLEFTTSACITYPLFKPFSKQ